MVGSVVMVKRRAAPARASRIRRIVASTAAQEAAEEAGLRYTTDARPGIKRVRRGKGFSYHRPDGDRITDEATLRWINSLVIPPAWREVWISTDRRGHLLATGRDDKRPQAIPVPPAVARGEGCRQVRLAPQVRRATSPTCGNGSSTRSRRRGGDPDRGDGAGGAASRRNTHPRRQPGVRQGQRDFRPHHPASRSRRPRRWRPGVRFPGQGWFGGAGVGTRPRAGCRRARLPGTWWPTTLLVSRRGRSSGERRLRPGQPLSRRTHRQRRHGQGLQDLGCNRRRGRCAVPV